MFLHEIIAQKRPEVVEELFEEYGINQAVNAENLALAIIVHKDEFAEKLEEMLQDDIESGLFGVESFKGQGFLQALGMGVGSFLDGIRNGGNAQSTPPPPPPQPNNTMIFVIIAIVLVIIVTMILVLKK